MIKKITKFEVDNLVFDTEQEALDYENEKESWIKFALSIGAKKAVHKGYLCCEIYIDDAILRFKKEYVEISDAEIVSVYLEHAHHLIAKSYPITMGEFNHEQIKSKIVTFMNNNIQMHIEAVDECKFIKRRIQEIFS